MPRRTNELDQLRAEIAALGAVKHLRRYPPELRQRIVSHAGPRRVAGESQAAVAKSLDMSDLTLARFLSPDFTPRSPKGRPRIRRQRRSLQTLIPITVTPDENARRAWSDDDHRIVVRGPSGLLIEGLSIRALAELIARVATCSD
jgi:hypothetical protein